MLSALVAQQSLERNESKETSDTALELKCNISSLL